MLVTVRQMNACRNALEKFLRMPLIASDVFEGRSTSEEKIRENVEWLKKVLELTIEVCLLKKSQDYDIDDDLGGLVKSIASAQEHELKNSSLRGIWFRVIEKKVKG